MDACQHCNCRIIGIGRLGEYVETCSRSRIDGTDGQVGQQCPHRTKVPDSSVDLGEGECCRRDYLVHKACLLSICMILKNEHRQVSYIKGSHSSV